MGGQLYSKIEGFYGGGGGGDIELIINIRREA